LGEIRSFLLARTLLDSWVVPTKQWMDLFGGCAVRRCRRADFKLRRRGSCYAHRAIVRPEHNERRARVTDTINAITDTDTITITGSVSVSGAAGTSTTRASGEKHRQAVG
jgi:hypothetical protein